MRESGKHIRDQLQDLYREIEATRMEGVPILNPALSVAAVGFEPFQDHYLGVLVTPWFMNLMLVPQDPEKFAASAPGVGEKVRVNLPAGQVELITGYEEGFGHSLSCSLFSPVFEFEDQEAALDTALAALAEVQKPDGDPSDDDSDMRDIWQGRLPEPETDEQAPPIPKEVSRRDFLRGTAVPGQQDQQP